MMQFQGSDEMLLAKDLPGAKKLPLSRKLNGLFGGGQVSGILNYFDLGFQLIYSLIYLRTMVLYQIILAISPILGYGTFGQMKLRIFTRRDISRPRRSIWKKNYKKFVTSKAEGKYSTLKD